MYASVLALAALAAGAVAQTTTTAAPSASVQSTVTVLLGTATGGFAASIVGVDACGTTMQLECTAAELCTAAPNVFVTQGPSEYLFSYSTSINGATGSISESCALSGPVNSASTAVCAQYASLSAPGSSTVVTTTVTLTGTELNYQPVPVTAGANLLTSATGTCTSSKGDAAPTAVPAALVKVVYKVIVPVGAALMALA